MNLNIQPRYLNLNDLFSRRLFRIPEYQRAYSWGSKERADLFSDIRTVREKKAPLHFMATVVGLRRDTRTIVTDEYSVVDVVDGQQRLTTLVILYKAIGKHLSREVATHAKIATEIQELLVKPDQLSLLLLQTNHDSSHHFANYLRTGATPDPREALTLADKALVNAMRECERFVHDWTEQVPVSFENPPSLTRTTGTSCAEEPAEDLRKAIIGVRPDTPSPIRASGSGVWPSGGQ